MDKGGQRLEDTNTYFLSAYAGKQFYLGFYSTGLLSSLLCSLTVCHLIVLSIPMETKRVKPILQEALGRIACSWDTALLSVKMSDSQSWPQVVLMFFADELPKMLCQTDEHVQLEKW